MFSGFLSTLVRGNVVGDACSMAMRDTATLRSLFRVQPQGGMAKDDGGFWRHYVASTQLRTMRNMTQPVPLAPRAPKPRLSPRRLPAISRASAAASAAFISQQKFGSELGGGAERATSMPPPMVPSLGRKDVMTKPTPESSVMSMRRGPGAAATLAAQQMDAVPPTAASAAARSTRKQMSKAEIGTVSDALNSRFSDIFKAFQYVDLDRSGTLNEKEIRRALDMWNIPIANGAVQRLIAACDHEYAHRARLKSLPQTPPPQESRARIDSRLACTWKM